MLWGREQIVGNHGTEQKATFKGQCYTNCLRIQSCRKGILLQWNSGHKKEKASLWEMWENEGKLAICISKSLALGCFSLVNINAITDHWCCKASPPTSAIPWMPVKRMTLKCFMAMTNHYLSGLFDWSSIILCLLQRLGVIDVGTQAITASHDATIQFCSTTKRSGTCQNIIPNIWLMPCAFSGIQSQWPKETTAV